MQRTLLLLISLLVLSQCHPSGKGPYMESDSVYLKEETLAEPSPIGVEGEQYNEFEENRFISTAKAPISTFSIDADGGSYSNTRRWLRRERQIPPRGAVRTEEIINYFPLDYPQPTNGRPVAVYGEVSSTPWNETTRIVRVGIQAKDLPREALPPANWVLLADISGSMDTPDKMKLMKEGFHTFVDNMQPQDRLAIVTYAGADQVALASTPGTEKKDIHRAIDNMDARGSTAGAAGIQTAYQIALENYIEGGNNRVILGSDGDFNVGIQSQDQLIELIEEHRDLGIFLTVLGYGRGNLNEAMMEQVANHGNGNYEYIDNDDQSDKVFDHEFSKFYTVAKDVKVQIDWNPDAVLGYRLVGYENRALATEDFEDDTKDAGEIGMGQNITALYEIRPNPNANASAKAFTFRVRYKEPNEDESRLLEVEFADLGNSFDQASTEHRFVTALAAWSMLLWDSEYKEGLSFEDVQAWGETCLEYDPQGLREEWLEDLVPMSARRSEKLYSDASE